jgi:anaerobic magnesium-protoporphyrin IX monomethyl ester cyclase
MKILLINPFAAVSQANNPPLGLCYIKASLLSAGFKQTTVVDLLKLNLKAAKKVIQEKNPDIVGISCFTDTRMNTFDIARIAKKINSNIKVIIGGPHATHMYKQILDNYPEIDFICLGEGEMTAVELAKAIESEKSIQDVRGVAFRCNGQIIKTAERSTIENLDDLPFPDYNDLDVYSYRGTLPFERGQPKASIVGSRGCVYNCIFCTNQKMWGKFRSRSAYSIVSEVEWLVRRYGFKYINFVDDLFTFYNDKVIEICKAIIEKKLNIQWSVQARVDTISRELIRYMHEAGCRFILFGVESGSPIILKNLNKRGKIEDVINAFNLCNEFKIISQISLIVGTPGESKSTLQETKELLKKIKPDVLTVNNLRIFPATRLSELAKSEKNFDDNLWLTKADSPYYTGSITQREMYKSQLELYLFYFSQKGFKGCIELLKFLWQQLQAAPEKVFSGLFYLIFKKE